MTPLSFRTLPLVLALVLAPSAVRAEFGMLGVGASSLSSDSFVEGAPLALSGYSAEFRYLGAFALGLRSRILFNDRTPADFDISIPFLVEAGPNLSLADTLKMLNVYVPGVSSRLDLGLAATVGVGPMATSWFRSGPDIAVPLRLTLHFRFLGLVLHGSVSKELRSANLLGDWPLALDAGCGWAF
jgi:hypothetical protein